MYNILKTKWDNGWITEATLRGWVALEERKAGAGITPEQFEELTGVKYWQFENETLFDDAAFLKFEEIKNKLPQNKPFVWGPTTWEGGADFQYMLEIKPHEYSPETDKIEWKDIKQSIRFVYPENSKLMVRGWRVK